MTVIVHLIILVANREIALIALQVGVITGMKPFVQEQSALVKKGYVEYLSILLAVMERMPEKYLVELS